MTELESKLATARVRLAAAMEAKSRADALSAAARELGGGLLSFGGSGSQRAKRTVQGAQGRAFAALNEADARIALWEGKIRSLERRIAESQRVRYSAADLAGATHVKTATSWRIVVRVSAKSVTVKTPYSWTDRIPIEQIRDFRIITPSAEGESL